MFTNQSTPPGYYWSSSEYLGRFPLSNGRFGDTFSYAEREFDGTTMTYDWTIAGRITSTSATGTVALGVSGAERAGQPFSFQMPAAKFTAFSG